jgi:uncharacterized protein (DUF1499 family)
VIGAVLLPLGALGYRVGALPLQAAFFVFLGGGFVLSAIALVGGIVALIVAMRSGRSADRSPLYIGMALGAVIVVLMLAQVGRARSVPPIHDISTDVADPPQFEKVVALRGSTSNPLEYDAAKLGPATQGAFPRVKSINTTRSATESFDRALAVLGGMHLEIVNADRDARRIEAVATSFWFGFKDDVVVRIRDAGAGAVVDLRSVSRVGVSDLGVNAKRIEEFIDRFQES